MNIRDRIVDFRRVKASELSPNPRNWRKHPEAQQNALRGILSEVGYVDALIARPLPDGRLELLDGHLRAETTPDDAVPVLVVDLDDAEAAKVLATFDPLAAMAEADDEALSALLAEVETDSAGLQELLDDLAGEEEGGGEVVEDEAPEPPSDPVTKPGDLWLLGEHRLLCGDCREAASWKRVMQGKRINVCMTSPPYASQRKYDESSGFKPIKPDEYVAWWEPVQANVRKHLAGDGSFFVNIKPHCEDGERVLYVFDLVLRMRRGWGWRFVDEFCWTRHGFPGGFDQRFKNGFEPVYHFAGESLKCDPNQVLIPSSTGAETRQRDAGRSDNSASGSGFNHRVVYGESVRPSNVLDVDAGESLHPATFPIGLPSFFIKAFSDDGDVIADPFLGSGTTLIAAEQLGRKCYGLEISAQYCDVIVKRWENLTGKKAVRE